MFLQHSVFNHNFRYSCTFLFSVVTDKLHSTPTIQKWYCSSMKVSISWNENHCISIGIQLSTITIHYSKHFGFGLEILFVCNIVAHESWSTVWIFCCWFLMWSLWWCCGQFVVFEGKVDCMWCVFDVVVLMYCCGFETSTFCFTVEWCIIGWWL